MAKAATVVCGAAASAAAASPLAVFSHANPKRKTPVSQSKPAVAAACSATVCVDVDATVIGPDPEDVGGVFEEEGLASVLAAAAEFAALPDSMVSAALFPVSAAWFVFTVAVPATPTAAVTADGSSVREDRREDRRTAVSSAVASRRPAAARRTGSRDIAW